MLLTKLYIPASDNNSVKRTHLFEKLNLGLERKLILISAPAGFGKTTLISDWINYNDIPTTWFSIDNSDNDLVDFINYIVSAIKKVEGNFGDSALELLNSPNKINPYSIINLLINDITTISKDFVLVLDDFHVIKNKEIFDLLSYSLDHIPNNIHIVLSTRSDPNFSIARLRSQDQLVELRSTELSFSSTEISALFSKKFSLKLSGEEIGSLKDITEGWIAGLQLAAISAQSRNIGEIIKDFKGGDRYIMDYLIEEVLKALLPETIDFLLKTSLFNQFSASMCNAVFERTDSQQVLEELEKTNMFIVSLDNNRTWYRYHHLFANLLSQRIDKYDKQSIADIHNKACIWFEKENMYEVALEHAIEVKNYTKCIQLLEHIIEDMWRRGGHDVILKYGELLPDELIKTSPDFCLFYSWILIASGERKKSETYLKSAEQITQKIINDANSSPQEVKNNKMRFGKISVGFAHFYSFSSDIKNIFHYSELAIKNLSEDDYFWYSWAWVSKGAAYFSSGNLQENIVVLNKAYECAQKTSDIYLISIIVIKMAESEQWLGNYKSSFKKCSELFSLIKSKGYEEMTKENWIYAAMYLIMASSHYKWGNADEALKNIQIAYELRTSAKDVSLRIYILLVYSFALTEYGINNIEEVESEYTELVDRAQIPPFLKSSFIGWKIYLYLKRNDIGNAERVALEYKLDINEDVDHSNQLAYAAYTQLLLMQSKFDSASILLEKLHVLVVKNNTSEGILIVKILYTILHKQTGKRGLAIKTLMEAMALASEENLLAFFVNSRRFIDELLQEIFKNYTHSEIKIPKQFIDDLKRAIAKSENKKQSEAISDLSSREIDTLQLMAKDLSNQEIADELFISITTVKTHVRNILLKLDAKNRRKAVSIAREKGIL